MIFALLQSVFISFFPGLARYLRYGVPITAAQLAVSAVYVFALFFLVGRIQ